MGKKIILHLISDSTGETLEIITRAILSQFDGIEIEKYDWSLIRNDLGLKTAIDGIRKNPGLVMYTILATNFENTLKEECKKMNVMCVPAIKHIIMAFQKYLNIENLGMSGRQHALNKDYYRQIDALEYTINHDDGNMIDGTLNDADVIIIGVSRTSKTPTSIYLSYKGMRVANIPYINNEISREKILGVLKDAPKKKCIVGFTISPERLQSLRETRLHSLSSQNVCTDYTNLEAIKGELKNCIRFLNDIDATIINVTEKSVEEVCVHIKSIYNTFRKTETEELPEG